MSAAHIVEPEAPPVLQPARRLRIAVVTPELHRGMGTERTAYEVTARLAQKHDVHLFAHDYRPEEPLHLRHHPVRVLRWPGLARFLSFYLNASRAIARFEAGRGEFDAVFSPGTNARQVNVVSACFCQRRQFDFLHEAGHRPRLVTLRERLKLLNRWLYAGVNARIERFVYRRDSLARVICPSRLLADDLANFYAVPQAKLRVVPSGVDGQGFTPPVRVALRSRARTELQIGHDEFVFLFAGNNWAMKGLMHVLAALARVPQVRLLIVGAREEPQAYEAFARQAGVAERVRFLPRRSDIMFYYAAADALVAPSVYETFGLMPLEAAACGLPILISATMGVAELFTEREATIVPRADDVPALAAAMQSLVSDTPLRESRARRALEVAARHPWDGLYAAVLEEVLKLAETRAATAVPGKST